MLRTCVSAPIVLQLIARTERQDVATSDQGPLILFSHRWISCEKPGCRDKLPAKMLVLNAGMVHCTSNLFPSHSSTLRFPNGLGRIPRLLLARRSFMSTVSIFPASSRHVCCNTLRYYTNSHNPCLTVGKRSAFLDNLPIVRPIPE